MQIFQSGNALELKQGRAWWNKLSLSWKMAYNEAVFGKGPTMEPPKDEELVILLYRADTLRFAGPMAEAPNLSRALDDFSGFEGLNHLTYISFSHSNATSLKFIRHLTKLRYLFIYNNKLKSLEGIEGMLELEELYCQNNQLTTIKSVTGLTNLKTLYVNQNKLTNLDGITYEHGNKLRNFYVEPNDDIPHRELIRVQNEYGIICRRVSR